MNMNEFQKMNGSDKDAERERYVTIANSHPELPHGDIRAAYDDIRMGIGYLIGQGHSPDELAPVINRIIRSRGAEGVGHEEMNSPEAKIIGWFKKGNAGNSNPSISHSSVRKIPLPSAF